MVKTAVILAAGLGSRLGQKTKEIPKGFLEVEDITLIERSVKTLLASGITKIVIGTGYLSEVYDTFALSYPEIISYKNDEYCTTGSMYTLNNLSTIIKEDFLLLESDLLYEKRAINELLNDERKNLILGSGMTDSGDEVFIELANEKPVKMSKNCGGLEKHAELVGISKVSYELYQEMCLNFKTENRTIDYEYMLLRSSLESNNIQVKKIENLLWCEIDDESHLKRAKSKIFPAIKSKDGTFVHRNVLLNPGPATTTDTVKYAQVVPDICPRESEFGNLMAWISEELVDFVADSKKYSAVLFGGSGTAAVEAVISSVIPANNGIFIVNNGAYGRRMVQIAQTYNISVVEFVSSAVAPLNLSLLQEVMEENQESFSHVAVVHHETTTGLLNDISGVASLAKKFGKELIVDAMSSYAAIPINVEADSIQYLIASSNKNIQGMAGISFVIAENKSLESLKELKARSFYLSLYDQYTYFKKTRQMRFTPPVQTMYALKQAIIETKEESISQRYKRYSECWKVLVKGLKVMNLNYLIDDKSHSRIITSIEIPDGIDFNDLHDYFYEKNYTIYPGKVEEFNTFRIANIGTIDKADMEGFIELLKLYLNRY